MRTRSQIDNNYQQTCFVIDSFAQRLDMTDTDFSPLYEQLRGLSPNSSTVKRKTSRSPQ
ncbi:hypothetical protein [Verminephrobacter aporrectodeae]|uniref:hypothetical protein n=1 Tax=Verminephrobacter aporrectodeae TaxID=1110389 RepID=UPI003908A196